MQEDINIEAYFLFLSEQGVPFCVVGPSEELPRRIESDVDIVIGVEPQVALDHIHRFCLDQRLKIVQHLQHEAAANYYVLWKKSGNDDRFVSMDICGDYVRNARLLLSSSDLLSERQVGVDARGARRTFCVPRPELGFVYYFLKQIEKMKLDDARGMYLSRQWRRAPSESRAQLSRFLQPESVALVETAAESGDWSEVRGHNVILQRQIHRACRRSLRSVIGEAKRLLKRLTKPTGLHVVFLGPDGSGKSRVLANALEALRPVFPRQMQRHLFPTDSSRTCEAPAFDDPHGKPMRGAIVSAGQLALWLLRFTIGWARNIWPAKVRSAVILFDRYYHDLFVDPRRYRYGGPMWLARAVGWVVPKPDLWIVLDAPPNVLQARKQEVSMAESIRQRDAYLAFAKVHDNAIVIDASQPLEEVSRQALRGVLELMSRRTVVRLGLSR